MASSYLELIKFLKVMFFSVILNVAVPGVSEKTKLPDQVRIRLISQLVNNISRVLQNYLNISIGQLCRHYF